MQSVIGKRIGRRWRWGLVLLLGAGAALTMAACSDDGDALQDLVDESETAGWEVQPGVEIVTLRGAEPGQMLTLYGQDGEDLATIPADDEGRAHFAYIPDEPLEGPLDEALAEGAASGEPLRPGRYIVRADEQDPPLATEPFTVLDRDDTPDPALYEEQDLEGARLGVLGDPVEGADLEDGYQYIEMRDGVKLSAMVRFPDESLYGEGPWPTVIELSGYGPSNPGSEEPGGRIARTLGYATVSVNLRGTGCSGGVFETFNPAQMADGYDVVETVARQPWVLNNQVGMVGLSYSGITQLYTAATQPPSLAAVTAQSVIADPWLQQWPGGVYNTGFTREWLEERERQSGTGSGWVAERVQNGDETCVANIEDQELGLDFTAFARALEMRPPAADDRDLRQLAPDIETAVFVSGAFQDEQTGPQFGALLDDFDSAEILRANMWNGRHPDGYSTMNVMDVFEFLELYVAERTPEFPEGLRDALTAEIAGSFGVGAGELEPNELRDEFGDDYEAALEHYESQDPVRVVFASGLGTDEVGAPGGVDEVRFASWPPEDADPRTWYLGPDGALLTEPPNGSTEASFRFDPEAAGTTALAGDYSVLSGGQEFDWTRFPDGRSLTFETEPLDGDVVIAGPGHVRLPVGVDGAEDADVQVAISEVRADGVEHLVQNGLLRLGHRSVDEERSGDLEIVHRFTEDAYEPLEGDGEKVEATVAIPSTGHVFSEGSKLRVTVSSPGRNFVRWAFEPPEGVDGETRYTVDLGGDDPAALVLPVVDVDVEGIPEEIPCPGLRGIPCRPAEGARQD